MLKIVFIGLSVSVLGLLALLILLTKVLGDVVLTMGSFFFKTPDDKK